jgi:hypothetical protein
MPPFNLCYVTRIIEVHGSCILHVCLDFARIFELSTLLAVVLLATLPEAPISPIFTTKRDASGLRAFSVTPNHDAKSVQCLDGRSNFANMLSFPAHTDR